VAFSPLSLFEGTEFQYTTFDYLWWVLTAFFILRALRTENPQTARSWGFKSPSGHQYNQQFIEKYAIQNAFHCAQTVPKVEKFYT
jgi:hypothetical protein